MKPKIKIIFFDVGNVLLYRKNDPIENLAKLFGVDNSAISRYHNQLSKDKNFKKLWNNSYDLSSQNIMSQYSAEKLLDSLNIEHNPKLIKNIQDIWTKQEFELLPNAFEVINYLSKKYKLGIISNALPSRRHNDLKEHNLLQYFDPIIISAEIGIHKPNKNIFLHALELAKVNANEAAFIDDEPTHLESAYSVGIVNLYQCTAINKKNVFNKSAEINNLIQLKNYL